MAFEKIPFYDSVGDTIFRSSGSITCLEAWGDKLFVGTQGGYLMQYLIEPPNDFSPSSLSASSTTLSSPSMDANENRDRKGKLVIGKKLELSPVHGMRLVQAMGMLIVLCGEKLTLHRSKDLQLIATVPSYKKIDTFCCCEPDPDHYLCLTIDRVLFLYRYETSYVLHDKFALPDPPVSIEWAGRYRDSNYVYLAFRDKYVLLELTTGKVRQLLSISSSTTPTMKLLPSDEILYCSKGSGHFSDITGFLNRQPLSFRDHPVALASSYPYVAALTTAGTVEIHSVFNPNSRNVSTFTFPSPAKAITSNGNLIVVATTSQFYLLVSTTHKHRYGDYETFVQIFQNPSSQRAAIKDYLNKILSSRSTPIGTLFQQRVSRFHVLYQAPRWTDRTVQGAKNDIDCAIRYIKAQLVSYLKEFLPKRAMARPLRVVGKLFQLKIYQTLIQFLNHKNKIEDEAFYRNSLHLKNLLPSQIGLRSKFWLDPKLHTSTSTKEDYLPSLVTTRALMHVFKDNTFSTEAEEVSLRFDRRTNQLTLLTNKDQSQQTIYIDDMYRNKHTLSFLWTTETPLAKFELPDLNSYSVFSHSLTNQQVVYSTRIADIGTLPAATPHLARPISLPDGLSTMDTRFIQPSSGAVNIEGEEGEGNEESVEAELEGEGEREGEEEDEEGKNIPYSKAIQVLRRLTEYSSAKKKLWCIHSALQTCIKCVQKFWRERKPEKNVVVGADDLVPIFSYIVLHSNIQTIMSEISFLMNFSDDQQLRGKEGYSLATFQTAVGFLNHFGEDQQLALSLSRGLPLQNEDAVVDEPHNISPNYLQLQRLLKEELEDFSLVTDFSNTSRATSTNTSSSSSLNSSPTGSPRMTSPLSVMAAQAAAPSVGAPLPEATQKRFGLPIEERCQGYYPCSLHLHRGQLFITQTYLVFESITKRIAINIGDVASIRKEKFAFILDNVLKVTLQDGQQFSFSSLSQRDEAFNVLLIQAQKCGLAVHVDQSKKSVSFSTPPPTSKSAPNISSPTPPIR